MKRILLLLLLFPIVFAQEPLFDIIVDIPQKYRIVSPGDELLSNIKLVNLGSAGRIDVFLDYWISDGNNIILKKRETVAVETQSNFVRYFDIPALTKPGNYELHAKLTYFDGREAASSYSFEIIKKEGSEIDINTLIYIIGSLAIIIFILLSINRLKPLFQRMVIKFKVYEIVRKRQKSS